MGLDNYFLVLVRIVFASAVFIPFTKFRNVPKKLLITILVIGAIQIGIMYLFMYHSYKFLTVPEILLFSIFTPFYVTLIYDVLKKRFHFLYLLSAGIAVIGAYIIRYDNISGDFFKGFFLMQGANICFAAGQSAYKYVLGKYKNFNQKEIFGYFHFGALIITGTAFLLFGNFDQINPSPLQWTILIWLGAVASGVGYFLWNKGATVTDVGILGIMNNALIPAGLMVNILIWNKVENYFTLTVGTLVILLSIFMHYKFMKMQNREGCF